MRVGRDGAATSAAEPRKLWDAQIRWLTVGLVLISVAVAFEALAVATVLPLIADELGNVQLYGWVFSAFLLTNLIGITVAGGEADRLGPAPPFVVGIGCFVAGLIIGGVAPSMEVLIAARALQGFGGGVINAVVYATIARAYPDDLKPQMLAVMSSAWVVPGLIGPALAGVIADTIGWRWIFLGLAPIPVLAATMTLPALRSLGGGTSEPRRWTNVVTAVMLAVGAGLVLAGIGAQSLGLLLVLIGVGGVIGGIALQRLLPPGSLVAAYGMPAAVLTAGLLNAAFFGTDAYVPLGLNDVRGQSVTMAGLTLTAATLTWTTGSWLQARLSPSTSRRTVTSVGLLLAVLGCGGIATLMFPAVPVLVAPFIWGVAGLGMGLAFSTLSLVVLEEAPEGAEGVATAGIQLMNVLGSALGTGVGGALVARADAADVGVGRGILQQDIAMVAVLFVALLTAQRLPGRPKAAAEDATTMHVVQTGSGD